MEKWLQLNETVRVQAQASGLPDGLTVTTGPGDGVRYVFGGAQYAVCGTDPNRPEDDETVNIRLRNDKYGIPDPLLPF